MILLKPMQQPHQTVGIDLLGPLPTSLKGNRYVLTVLDYFTHWPILIPVPNKEARTSAEALFVHVICEHGAFERLLSNRESTLAAPVVSSLLELMKQDEVSHRHINLRPAEWSNAATAGSIASCAYIPAWIPLTVIGKPV